MGTILAAGVLGWFVGIALAEIANKFDKAHRCHDGRCHVVAWHKCTDWRCK